MNGAKRVRRLLKLISRCFWHKITLFSPPLEFQVALNVVREQTTEIDEKLNSIGSVLEARVFSHILICDHGVRVRVRFVCSNVEKQFKDSTLLTVFIRWTS